jgi:pimeloyl-ACP methyl ester carboxylesterase
MNDNTHQDGIYPFPAGMQSHEIETNGAKIHVRVGGRGPAVVMLHGFGTTGDMWGHLASALIEDHMVVAPDLRGPRGVTVSGSCLVISCATYDDDALAKRLAAEYTAGQFVNHSRADVESFFAGLDLVGPGVAEAQSWRPWQPEPVLRRREGHVLAGVARRNA